MTAEERQREKARLQAEIEHLEELQRVQAEVKRLEQELAEERAKSANCSPDAHVDMEQAVEAEAQQEEPEQHAEADPADNHQEP